MNPERMRARRSGLNLESTAGSDLIRYSFSSASRVIGGSVASMRSSNLSGPQVIAQESVENFRALLREENPRTRQLGPAASPLRSFLPASRPISLGSKRHLCPKR
jgi:hypothetical protein